MESERLYISDKLKTKFPELYNELNLKLKENSIDIAELQNTKDIWCKDYMPHQTASNKFIQFKYHPDYLDYAPELKTDATLLYKQVNITASKSNLVIDGGNIIRNNKVAFLTLKILSENKGLSKEHILETLKKELEVDSIILLPNQPYDKIGHSDGMVRFVNDSTIIINDYTNWESKSFVKRYENCFKNLGFTIYKSPYYHTNKKHDGIYSAEGCYINFIKLKDYILLPQFGNLETDKKAMEFYSKVFPNKTLIPINAEKLALHGGVLNCISWVINQPD